MPPRPGAEWSAGEVATLRRFLSDLNARRSAATVAADEVFPATLLAPYDGPKPSEGPGNTFLGFRQLKGKIKTIFHDDWRRDERDLFQENLTQFGGADFVRRFDESTRATPSFLSALDGLARDVATKAFLNRSGPFDGIDTDRSEPDRADIARLYRAILYRNPTDAEQAAALALFRDLEARRESLATEDGTLAFELQVDDDARTAHDPGVLHRADDGPARPLPGARGPDQDRGQRPAAPSDPRRHVPLRSGRPGADPPRDQRRHRRQRLGRRDRHPPRRRRGRCRATVVTVKDPAVQLEGSWQFLDRDGLITCEDNNENKGDSILTFPIAVAEAGEYQVTLLYRRSGGDHGSRTPGPSPPPPA